MKKAIDNFFNPKSVAVIGASRNPQKIGYIVFRNFLDAGFKGRIYPVNPNAEEILGHKTYPSVLDIKDQIDLAVIAVPAPIAVQALEECGKKGIKAVTILSGGFKEVGEKALEDRVTEIAKKYGVGVVGPNCLGIFDPSTGVDMIFLPRYRLERPKQGNIAFITQSGAIGSVVLDWMARKGYKISKFVSYGNAADVDEADLIEYLGKDRKTKVICAYFEGLREAKKFMEVTKKISGKKPVIVLKGGKTEAGRQAISSHTGSMAGSYEVYKAAFKQAGVLHATDLEEIFSFARTLSTMPIPHGNRVQIITDGGGFGVLLSDGVIENGLTLSKMDDKIIGELRKSMPTYVVLKNPMDLTGDTNMERYRLAIDAAMQDPNVDIIGLIALLQVPRLEADIIEVITNVFKSSKKPIFVIAAGGEYTEVLKKALEDFGVPTFSYPEDAAKCMRILYEFGLDAKKIKKGNK
jgi:acetyl coenzyme A synthetase (ADP forming)-like protein